MVGWLDVDLCLVDDVVEARGSGSGGPKMHSHVTKLFLVFLLTFTFTRLEMDGSSLLLPSDSRIPHEVERIIFEIAALSRPVSIPNLMLVAWRVKEWYVTPTPRTRTLNDSFQDRASSLSCYPRVPQADSTPNRRFPHL